MNVKARTASSFVDSVGVNVHLFYQDTVYWQGYETIVKPRLKELRIKHIRDNGSSWDVFENKLIDLYNSLGIRSNLISGYPGITPLMYQGMAKRLKHLMSAIEFPNEFNIYAKSPDWASMLKTYIFELHPLLKADSDTAKIPIIGPSVACWSPVDYDAVGDLSNYVDYGNLHPYHPGLHPLVYCGWETPPGSYLEVYFDRAKRISKNKPIIVTETGQHNAMNVTLRNLLPVPKDIGQKYISRQLLYNFSKGIRRTFIYELIDLFENPAQDDCERHFGLLHNNGTPKPVFFAVRDLLNLFSDSKKITPRSLDYSLSGQPNTVQQILLEKSNGCFYLILWNEVSSYEPLEKKELVVTPVRANLQLAKDAKTTVYSLNPELKKVKDFVGKAIALDIPDYPLIVEINAI